MPSTIFTIANQKGGVGKTTTAINLGAALAENNVPTLIIDLDPQANATSALGMDRVEGGSIYGVLTDNHNPADLVLETAWKNLYLLPSEVDLAAAEIELSQTGNYLGHLRKSLKGLREQETYRAIILDCPPALGLLSMNSLAAADFLLIALQCEYLAMEGLGQILSVVDQLKEAGVNPALNVGGVLMTMFDIRTNLSRQVVEEVRRHLGDTVFQAVIPRTIRLGEAPSFGKPIMDYDPTSPGATAYRDLAREVITRFSLK